MKKLALCALSLLLMGSYNVSRESRNYVYVSPGGGGAVEYIAGYYDWSTTDANPGECYRKPRVHKQPLWGACGYSGRGRRDCIGRYRNRNTGRVWYILGIDYSHPYAGR